MTDGSSNQVASEQPALFRIGEVSRLTGIKAFVLRYWETEFPMLQPVKSQTGHRLYRREDIEIVFEIKRLLYDEGFTIAGARKLLTEHPDKSGAEAGTIEGSPAPSGERESTARADRMHFSDSQRALLLTLREELAAILTLLKCR